MAVADVLTLEEDPEGPDTLEKGKRYSFWHPAADYRHFYHEISGKVEKLLKPRMENGNLFPGPSLGEIKAHVEADLDSFDSSYKRFLNPHVYKVSFTERLRNLKLELIKNYLGDL
jgi:nicotinate phosphoribosyltransferase